MEENNWGIELIEKLKNDEDYMGEILSELNCNQIKRYITYFPTDKYSFCDSQILSDKEFMISYLKNTEEKIIYWDSISYNDYISWDFELLKLYENKIYWKKISEKIPLNDEIIKYFYNKIDWNALFRFNSLVTADFAIKYEEKTIEFLQHLSYYENTKFLWDNKFIDHFHKIIKNKKILKMINAGVIKDMAYFLKLFPNFVFEYAFVIDTVFLQNFIENEFSLKTEEEKVIIGDSISCNEEFEWTVPLIEKMYNYINWERFSEDAKINVEIFHKYLDKIDLSSISKNNSLKNETELFLKYQDKVDWREFLSEKIFHHEKIDKKFIEVKDDEFLDFLECEIFIKFSLGMLPFEDFKQKLSENNRDCGNKIERIKAFCRGLKIEVKHQFALGIADNNSQLGIFVQNYLFDAHVLPQILDFMQYFDLEFIDRCVSHSA